MILLAADNAQSNLSTPLSASSTSIALTAGSGALFPQPGANQYFTLTLNDAATGLVYEIVNVTAVTGDTMTVVRGQEGTTATTWALGDIVFNGPTAGSVAAIRGFRNLVSFSANGSWTLPTGITGFRVTVVGGGGGGSKCTATSLAGDASGGGGGAGGMAIKYYSSQAPGTSYSFTIGAGGTTQVMGGTTIFNGAVTANGGNGSAFASPTSGAGGLGGTASGGDLNLSGGDGSDGQSNSFVFAGNGAPGPFGGGGRAGQLAGLNATNYGGGGGGAYDSTLTGNVYNGGLGGTGIVIIEY